MKIPKPCLSVLPPPKKKKKKSWLRQYQPYISNWYHQWKGPNDSMQTQKIDFIFESSKLNLSVRTQKINQPGFVNISHTLVINTSMERSSRVLHHEKKKTAKLNFDLYFDLYWRAEINISVGLNMHLYVDIGDASSSLRGSTSSFESCIWHYSVTITAAWEWHLLTL